jgi:1-acyl-sn-glycerol-3-phosphate acyltransferase
LLAWLLALTGPALLVAVAAGVLDLLTRDDLTWRGRLAWVGAAVVSPPITAVAYALTRPFRVDRTLLPAAADVTEGGASHGSAAGAGSHEADADDGLRGPVGSRERVVRQVGQAAVRGLFRSVEVASPPVPAGPQLWIASHFGAFSDPLVLVHALDRPPRYLAADGLFRVPLLGWLLRLAGAVPVRRSQDGGGAVNQGAFSAAWEALADGAPVGIFPEGIANDTTSLASLRTGAARIALGAPVTGLQVVPVGIHYEDKAGLRQRVFVDVGHALDVDAWRASAPDGGDERATVRALTAELEARLREVAPEFVDLVEQQALRTAATVALRTDDAPRPSWGQRADLADALGRRSADDRAALVTAVDAYRRDLEAAGLDDEVVVGHRPVPARRLVVQAVVAALLLPPAAIGAVLHAPVVALAWASGRLRVAPVTAATIRPLVALVGAVLTWSAVTWWLLASATVDGVLAALAVGFVLVPLWGLAAVVLGERSLLAVRALSRLPARRRRRPVIETLRVERQRVVDLVRLQPTGRGR